MSDEAVIRTRGLTKYFRNKAAVYEMDLDVPQGGVFALLGRNGSGKTTTIRMLLGLVAPTRGRGTILGCDIRRITPDIRERIGYLTEGHELYNWMKVRQCAEFQSAFYPRWNEKLFRGVVTHFGLDENSRVSDLSRGERAGLCLALTLAPDPQLLILDDPALGLDPVARRSLVESIIYLTRRSDRTIVFSSHQLSDVERVADYIGIMDDSVLRACCPIETFRDNVQQVRLRFQGTPPHLPQILGVIQARRTAGELHVVCANYNAETEFALKALNPIEIERMPLPLEDAFISYLSDHGEKSFILSEMEEQS